MRILAIETSCDETAIAVIEASRSQKGLKNPAPRGGVSPLGADQGVLRRQGAGSARSFISAAVHRAHKSMCSVSRPLPLKINPHFKIVKNLVASQIKIHKPFGGVVPNLAKREHLKNLPILFDKIFYSSASLRAHSLRSVQAPRSNLLSRKKEIASSPSAPRNDKAQNIVQKIDLIAVTVGPGLEPALWTGINFAKKIKKQLNAPLLGISHLDGHLYSFLLSQKKENLQFPAIALIVSGGHTILIKMDSLIKFKKIGETRDDAVGEAFDKVARLLNLPYPGGPEIEKLAKQGNRNAISFPRPMIHQKNYDFSFSGLKTSVLYWLKRKQEENPADVAASFQSAAFDVLISKTLRAAKEFNAKSIFVSGGVSANKNLKKEFQKSIKNKFKGNKPVLNFTKFPTDNAVMIAAAGYINFLQKKNRRLIARSDISI